MPEPSNHTDGLTVQQADALWDAVAIPGPHTPTYPEQHERVCRAVAGILTELPPPADRAAVIAEAIAAVEDPQERAKTTTGLGLGWESARDVLRRMADEAQQEPEYTESVIYEVVGDWGVDSADSAEGARAAVTKWLRAYPKCGAHAQQRIYRDWPDGSEWYGPWTDLPGESAAGSAGVQATEAPE